MTKTDNLHAAEERDRLVAVLNSTSDMVSMADLDGNIVYLNPAGEKLLGWDSEKVAAGTKIHDAHPQEAYERVSKVGVPSAIENGVWRGMTSIINSEGTVIPVSQVIISHKDEEGNLSYLSTIIRDTREELAAHNEREEFIRELQSRNLDLQQFNYAVSHDLKSPLITINGFLWKLQKDIKAADDSKIQKDINVISDSVTKIHNLLDDMLSYSKTSSKVRDIKETNLCDIIEMVKRLIRGEFGDLCDCIDIDENVPPLFGDETALTEVFLNIISNAIKYRNTDKDLRIVISAVPGGKMTTISIKDNGIGIDPEYCEKIFRIFERLNADSCGNGVGLSIAKSIVTKHGGRLWAESEGINKGSTFFLSLPQTR